MPRRPLSAALAAEVVMADGGLSTLLEAAGVRPTGPMWTGEVLATRPEAVGAAHEAALAAGARVVLTAGYQISRRGAVASGRPEGVADRLLVEANRVALAARSRRRRDGWVAASIGPFGAALADRSEYRGGYAATDDELRIFHRERLKVLAEAQHDPSTRVDLWWCETFPEGREIEGLADELLVTVGTLDADSAPELVVTMTVVADGRVPTGEPVDEALGPMLAADPNTPGGPVAVGVNCCGPGHVAPALQRLARATPLPLVAKPNLAGSLGPTDGLVATWLDLRARLVGGCCGTGAAELRALADELERHRPR
ncbi:MAG: homocysteine S-methyltransferase family protein [Microthrixaceae bacterium]